MEEVGLLGQLGTDRKLFLSQAFNFFILLGVLTLFVYKPLLSVIKKRNEKIKTGLEKAEQADIRLKEIDSIGKEKLKQADQQSVNIIKATEDRAKVLAQEMQKKNEEKQKEMQKQAEDQLKKQLEENKKVVLSQAGELIKKAIAKTVELKPEAVDQALIKKATESIKNE